MAVLRLLKAGANNNGTVSGRLCPIQVPDPLVQATRSSFPPAVNEVSDKMNSHSFFHWIKEEVEESCQVITEKMAYDSEEEADSDAEDGKILKDESMIPVSSCLSTCPSRSGPSAGREASTRSLNSETLIVESQKNFQIAPFSTGLPKAESVMDIDWSDNINHHSCCWKKKTEMPQEFKNFKFREPTMGPSNNAHVNISSPKDIFCLFFTKRFTDFLIDQSNLYAKQKLATLDLSAEELFAFIGMLIIMGYHTLPSIRLYWSQNRNYRVERVANIMPIKRFLKILNYLHLNDCTKAYPIGHPQFDKLHKIRPMISHLNEKFKERYNPSRWLSMNESVVRHRGKSQNSTRPRKPRRRGFKLWILCCSDSGYALNMDVCTGKGYSGSYLGEEIVEKSMEQYSHKGYAIFCNPFFSSVGLAGRLLKKQVFICGLLRTDRRVLPNDVLKGDKEMKKGESDCAQAGDISVVKWRDGCSKPLCILSTMHNPKEIISKIRWANERIKKKINIPKAFADHNNRIGGVDMFEQLMTNYSVSWRTRRWWIKLFYYFLDATIVNSYLLYRETYKKAHPQSKPMPHLEFRSLLADELIGQYSKTMRKRKTITDVRFDKVGDHLPVKLPTKNRSCAGCLLQRIRKQSIMGCKRCDVALCLQCFVPYHTPPVSKTNLPLSLMEPHVLMEEI